MDESKPERRLVLLVEDNADDEELTRMAFESSAFSIELCVVRDGVEALDFLFVTGTHAGRDPRLVPHVVLLDLKLPRVSGLEVLRRIRADERTRTIPVVVLTSSIEEEDVFRSYEAGANAYVRKSVDFGTFRETIERLAAFWLLVNEPPPKPWRTASR